MSGDSGSDMQTPAVIHTNILYQSYVVRTVHKSTLPVCVGVSLESKHARAAPGTPHVI